MYIRKHIRFRKDSNNLTLKNIVLNMITSNHSLQLLIAGIQ